MMTISIQGIYEDTNNKGNKVRDNRTEGLFTFYSVFWELIFEQKDKRESYN